MRWSFVVAALLSSAAAPAACAYTWPDAPSTSGNGTAGHESDGGTGGAGAGGSTSSTETGGGSDCGERQVCFPTLSAPWVGPVLLQQGEATPACPPEYPSIAFDGGTHVSGNPLTCATCSCGFDPCNLAGEVVETFLNTDCSGQPHDSRPYGGDCDTFSDGHPTVHFLAVPTNPAIACGHSPPGVTSRPDPVVTGSSQVCGPAAPDAGADGGEDAGAPTSCGSGGTCTAVPTGVSASVICAYAPGPTPCPDALKGGVRFDITTAFEDHRVCSDCACAPPHEFCGSTTDVFEAGSCAGAPFASVGAGVCVYDPSGPNLRSFQSRISGTSPCDPIQSESMGAVDATAVMTVCCY